MKLKTAAVIVPPITAPTAVADARLSVAHVWRLIEPGKIIRSIENLNPEQYNINCFFKNNNY